MKTLKTAFIITLGIVSFNISYAAENATENATENITVPIPQSQLHMPPTEVVKSNHPFIELQVSSWSPRQFSTSSDLQGTSDFSTVTPLSSLSYGSLVYEGNGYNLLSKLGLSFTELQRSGLLKYDDSKLQASQNLNMYQLQLGLEFAGTHELVKNVTPMAGLYLLPTWSQSGSSAFNDGISELDLLTKISVGVSWNISPLATWLGVQEAALEFGTEGTESLSGGNFANAGLWTGTRISWK